MINVIRHVLSSPFWLIVLTLLAIIIVVAIPLFIALVFALIIRPKAEVSPLTDQEKEILNFDIEIKTDE